MNAEQVFGVVRDAVVTVMEVEPGTISRETRLVEDLRCDSLALVEIVEIVEETLRPLARNGFAIDDTDLDDMRTVGEAVDYAVARL
jgi:acyl carrier protein